MYKEEWITSDGEVLAIKLNEGVLDENIEYQMFPYYSSILEHWMYPVLHSIFNCELLAENGHESITHKLTNY